MKGREEGRKRIDWDERNVVNVGAEVLPSCCKNGDDGWNEIHKVGNGVSGLWTTMGMKRR